MVNGGGNAVVISSSLRETARPTDETATEAAGQLAAEDSTEMGLPDCGHELTARCVCWALV